MDSDQTGQAFTATLIGDISGNYGGAGALGRGAMPRLALAHTTGRQGGAVVVPLTLTPGTGGLFAISLRVDYDERFLTLESAEPGPAAADSLLAMNDETSGSLLLALAAPSTLTVRGTIVNLTFRVSSSALGNFPLTLGDVVLNEGFPQAQTEAGSVSVENEYELTILAENGTVGKLPDQTLYDYLTTVTLTATPDEGFYFLSWSGDIPMGKEHENPLILTVDAEKTVTAIFAMRKSRPAQLILR